MTRNNNDMQKPCHDQPREKRMGLNVQCDQSGGEMWNKLMVAVACVRALNVEKKIVARVLKLSKKKHMKGEMMHKCNKTGVPGADSNNTHKHIYIHARTTLCKFYADNPPTNLRNERLINVITRIHRIRSLVNSKYTSLHRSTFPPATLWVS